MKMFRPKPKIRLKVGSRYFGKNNQNYTAQGYVMFKEWDAEDNKFYYWEEWEITGLEDYDSWVEYDHYLHTIKVYKPVDVTPELNAADLKKYQQVSPLTIDGAPQNVTPNTVSEVGIGTVARLEGKMTYQLFEDDQIHYAAIATGTGELSIEDYRTNEHNEKDYYLGRTLTKKQQKDMFGRVLQPRVKNMGQVVAVGFVLLFMFGPTLLPFAIPQYETTCTPRTATTSTSRSPAVSTASALSPANNSEQTNDTQICTRKRVYFNGGSGGGIGK